MREQVKEFLRLFYRENKNFSREVGLPQRYFMEDFEEFLYFFEFTMIRNLDCYLSINPYKAQNELYGIEKIFFDFDSPEGPERAEGDFNATCKAIEELGIVPLKAFSGKKGYHVYLYLPEIIEMDKVDGKIFNRFMLNKLTEELELPQLDAVCTKDVARIARVPYSLHPRARPQKMCRVLDDNPIKAINDAISNPIPQRIVDDAMKAVEKKIHSRLMDGREHSLRTSWRGKERKGTIRQCLLVGLKNKWIDGGQDHYNRIAFTLDAKHAGLSVDEAVDLLETVRDFDRELTRNYIEDLYNRDYEYRVSCKNLVEMGICNDYCGKKFMYKEKQ